MASFFQQIQHTTYLTDANFYNSTYDAADMSDSSSFISDNSCFDYVKHSRIAGPRNRKDGERSAQELSTKSVAPSLELRSISSWIMKVLIRKLDP